jgi:type IV pilus assembly protein PilZ
METNTLTAEEVKSPNKRLVIGTEAQLRRYYMPYLKGGGLFLITESTLAMGDQLLLEVRLFGEEESVLVKCKVVWFAPSNPARIEQRGVGVQFIDDKSLLKNMIESKLAALGTTVTPTATM